MLEGHGSAANGQMKFDIDVVVLRWLCRRLRTFCAEIAALRFACDGCPDRFEHIQNTLNSFLLLPASSQGHDSLFPTTHLTRYGPWPSSRVVASPVLRRPSILCPGSVAFLRLCLKRVAAVCMFFPLFVQHFIYCTSYNCMALSRSLRLDLSP